jgi:hypothetical protein
MPTRGEKVLLAVMSLTTLGFGTMYLLSPQEMAALSGLAATRPEATAELRGYYGGLQIGMGVLFALGLRFPSWSPIGLGAAAALFLANGLGRVLGIVLVGQVDTFNLGGVVFEFTFGVLALTLLRSRYQCPPLLGEGGRVRGGSMSCKWIALRPDTHNLSPHPRPLTPAYRGEGLAGQTL